MGNHFRFPGGFNSQSALCHPVGNGFMGDYMFSLIHRSNSDGSMKMIGRHDLDRINIAFFFQ